MLNTNFAGLMNMADMAVINNRISGTPVTYEFTVIASRENDLTVRAMMLNSENHLITDMIAEISYYDVQLLADKVTVDNLESVLLDRRIKEKETVLREELTNLEEDMIAIKKIQKVCKEMTEEWRAAQIKKTQIAQKVERLVDNNVDAKIMLQFFDNIEEVYKERKETFKNMVGIFMNMMSNNATACA